ncbi:hypothetical protein WN55_04026 [Dufourea novaeangliae]|uniref:Uncharacterized protein n=1 Tax=Dufourea novaeangliae TaxID=178035 RepID=A0A154PMG5_DUFNO|nr:hypothetical protein WN55_04026 [Dufourea novaeangliae]
MYFRKLHDTEPEQSRFVKTAYGLISIQTLDKGSGTVCTQFTLDEKLHESV